MAWIAGLAVVALAMAGWRKTARAQPKTPRSAMQTPRRIPYEVHVAPAPLYRPAGVLRRLWAVIASTGLTLIIGAIIATIAGFSIAFIVTTMTDLLKQ
jgi:hypothetical protein